MSYENRQPNSSKGSLTSDPNQFSDEAWNVLIDAQDIARRWRHQQLDVEHLMQVIFIEPAYSNLLNKLTINHLDLLDQLEDFLAEQQIAQGKELFIGDALENLLEKADWFHPEVERRRILGSSEVKVLAGESLIIMHHQKFQAIAY